jgi:hypothetical protein
MSRREISEQLLKKTECGEQISFIMLWCKVEKETIRLQLLGTLPKGRSTDLMQITEQSKFKDMFYSLLLFIYFS